MTANAAARLIQHYVDNFRRLPWRSPPGESPRDPYRVWLSEVMLQQTTVATVTPRFERFVARWPTVEALAAASDEEILWEWAGLGYYARVRNLIACARDVVRRGGFPRTATALRELPGIGAYTSAAIAAIAFGERAPAVDTNVARVIARLHGLKRPARADVDRLMLQIMPDDRPGDFVQAMMDLGATICRPRNPRCFECPLATDCAALAAGDPQAYPEPKRRPVRPHRYGIAWWVERRGAVWLVRRPVKGLLGGMAALPGPEWGDSEPGSIDCDRRRPPRLHPLLARPLRCPASRAGGRRLVAAARPPRRGRAADPLPPGRGARPHRAAGGLKRGGLTLKGRPKSTSRAREEIRETHGRSL